MSDPEVRRVRLRDTTLREGRDVAGVSFSAADWRAILEALARAGVIEAEVVAPARVMADLQDFPSLPPGPRPALGGLVYAASGRLDEEIEACASRLDCFDVLVPLAAERAPAGNTEKAAVLARALERAASKGAEAGAGFPHSTQAPAQFVVDMARVAKAAGARRITLYDTNGGADPFAVRELVARVKHVSGAIPVFFHGHDDLGLATANSLAAVLAGADGLDVTVNGIGDRAGNAPLEQVALVLHLRGFDCGVDLRRLRGLSETVAEASRIPVHPLAPVVGGLVFQHVSPAHLKTPGLFEAFPPELVGGERTIEAPPSSAAEDDERRR